MRGPLTRQWWHTPRLVRGLTGTVVAALLVAAAVAGVVLSGGRSGIDAIGHRSAPQAVRSADLYFALNDMDAQVANLLLVGADRDFDRTRAEARTTYEQRRAQADADLQQAAEHAAGDSADQRGVHDVLGELGAYEALVARAELQEEQAAAPAGQPAPAALADYRAATDLLRQQLLPAADQVIEANTRSVDSSYAQERGALAAGRWWVLLAGLAAVAALVLLQRALATRFRRRINPPLAVATLLTALALLGALNLLGGTAHHLDTAKRSAYDSVIALGRARAVAYDMNADESRFLTDPSRADGYLSSYRQKAGRTEEQLRAELRNVTFDGEQDLAQQELADFQKYQEDDRRMRELQAGGQLKAAVGFDTGTAAGQSNADFDRFADAIGATLDVNQRAFDHEVSAADQALGGGGAVAGAVGLVVTVALVLIGVRPRLREYR